MQSLKVAVTCFATILLLGTAVATAQQPQAQAGNDTGGAAAGAGSSLSGQSLFSTSGDTGAGLGQLGSGVGRFQGNQLANQPLAGQSNLADQSFNRLLQVQTLQQSNQLGRQFSGGGGTRTSTIRPSLRLGFAIKTRPKAEITSSVNRRFEKLAARISRLAETRPAFTAVDVAVIDSGDVVLTGEVESDSARRLAANLLRMEPGVRTVKNDLTVAAK